MNNQRAYFFSIQSRSRLKKACFSSFISFKSFTFSSSAFCRFSLYVCKNSSISAADDLLFVLFFVLFFCFKTLLTDEEPDSWLAPLADPDSSRSDSSSLLSAALQLLLGSLTSGGPSVELSIVQTGFTEASCEGHCESSS